MELETRIKGKVVVITCEHYMPIRNAFTFMTLNSNNRIVENGLENRLSIQIQKIVMIHLPNQEISRL